MIDDLMLKYNVQLDSVEIKKFIKQLKAYDQDKNFDGDPLDRFSDEDKKTVLSKFDSRSIEINNILSALRKYPKDKRPELKGYNDIKMYVIDKFRNELLEKYVDELGYTKNPEFIKTARSMMYGVYKEKIVNREVRQKIPDPTAVELERFYENNKDAMFKEPDGTYKEYNKVKVSITNSIKGKLLSQAMNDWEDKIFKDYKVSVDYSLLEESFDNVPDDRK